MVDFRTVKAKECCCGCTLRTGSLTLFWTNLVLSCIGTLYYLTEVLYSSSYRYYYRNAPGPTAIKIRSIYYFIWSIIGVIVSLLGIFGIQKNIPKHLTFGLYYMGYFVLYFLLSIITVCFFPKTFISYMMGGTVFGVVVGTSEFVLIAIVSYLFCIALMLYFMLIIRSCRDSMMKNSASSNADEIPDPAALGYNASY